MATIYWVILVTVIIGITAAIYISMTKPKRIVGNVCASLLLNNWLKQLSAVSFRAGKSGVIILDEGGNIVASFSGFNAHRSSRIKLALCSAKIKPSNDFLNSKAFNSFYSVTVETLEKELTRLN